MKRFVNWFKRDAVSDGKDAFEDVDLEHIDRGAYLNLKYDRHGEPHPDWRVLRSRKKYVKYFLRGLRRVMMKYVEELNYDTRDTIMSLDRRNFKNFKMCEHCKRVYQKRDNYCGECGRELIEIPLV